MFGGTPAKGPNPLKHSAKSRYTENSPENAIFPAATDGELDIRLAIKERKTVRFRTPSLTVGLSRTG